MDKKIITLKNIGILGIILSIFIVAVYHFKKQYDMETINTLAGDTDKKYSEPLNYLFISNVNFGKIYSLDFCESFCVEANKEKKLLDSICYNDGNKSTSKFDNVFYADTNVNFCTNKDDTVVSKFKFVTTRNEFKESIIKRIGMIDEEFYKLEAKKQELKKEVE